MSIFARSRYRVGSNGKKITATKVTLSSGKEVTFLHNRKVLMLDDMTGVVALKEVILGDMVDLISHDACGDDKRWYVIADINELFYPDDEVEVGARLLIPSPEDMLRS